MGRERGRTGKKEGMAEVPVTWNVLRGAVWGTHHLCAGELQLFQDWRALLSHETTKEKQRWSLMS